MTFGGPGFETSTPQTENDSGTFGSPRPGIFPPFELHAVARLFAGIAERRKGEAALVEAVDH